MRPRVKTYIARQDGKGGGKIHIPCFFYPIPGTMPVLHLAVLLAL